jgi:hypothetical protein
MRRAIFVLVATFALLVLGAGQAFATHCFNTSKPAGAGSAGTFTINVVTEEFTAVDASINPAGNLQGGFLSLTPVLPDGTPVGPEVDVFKKDLPDGAHNAGPGDNECDGIGIDDILAC